MCAPNCAAFFDISRTLECSLVWYTEIQAYTCNKIPGATGRLSRGFLRCQHCGNQPGAPGKEKEEMKMKKNMMMAAAGAMMMTAAMSFPVYASQGQEEPG